MLSKHRMDELCGYNGGTSAVSVPSEYKKKTNSERFENTIYMVVILVALTLIGGLVYSGYRYAKEVNELNNEIELLERDVNKLRTENDLSEYKLQKLKEILDKHK